MYTFQFIDILPIAWVKPLITVTNQENKVCKTGPDGSLSEFI